MAHLLYYEILLHVLIRTNSSQISPSEWYMLNTFVRDLNSIKKRCISVYYPRGSGTETVDLLRKTKRDAAAEKIESAIEKRIVKLQKKPISGKNAISTFCIFGWINGGKVIAHIYILGKKPYKTIQHIQNVLIAFLPEIGFFCNFTILFSMADSIFSAAASRFVFRSKSTVSVPLPRG